MLKEALPVIMQCRLMEMIELKPWINRARANTPEAARLALNHKRMGSLTSRMQKVDTEEAKRIIQSSGRAPSGVAAFSKKKVRKLRGLHRRLEGTLETHGRDLFDAATDQRRNSGANAVTRPIAQSLSSANAQMLDPGLRSRLDLSPTMEPLSGRKMKGMGRPSPASARPEGLQDLRGKSAGNKLYPWQKESSIVRRGCLMEREYIKGGKAAGMDAKRFPKQQLRMGTKVEHEHTPKAGVAQEIAKDHLAEFPDYYTRLHKMERDAARALRSKRGGKMRELKHEITESIVRRGILKEGFLKPPMRRALSDVKKVGTGFVKDLVPVDWLAADGWKGKAKGAATELASYGAGKLTGLPVVPYHTGAAAMDVVKKRQAIQARYKRMKQAKTHLMPEMEEVPVELNRPARAKPLWAGNHGMRGVE